MFPQCSRSLKERRSPGTRPCLLGFGGQRQHNLGESLKNGAGPETPEK